MDGIRSFLQNGDIGAVDRTFLVLLVKLMHVMEYFNRASVPFQNVSGETQRVNQLNTRCKDTADKLLNTDTGCKGNVPEKLKPKIDEGIQLLASEVRKIEQERDKLKLRWIGVR